MQNALHRFRVYVALSKSCFKFEAILKQVIMSVMAKSIAFSGLPTLKCWADDP